MFQSSPDPKAGCYFLMEVYRPTAEWFQSSPDPKAGCYPLPGPGCPPRDVSILTRPEGRVLPMAIHGLRAPDRFQSSPDPKAGCYGLALVVIDYLQRFNPHPTRRPGATISNTCP